MRKETLALAESIRAKRLLDLLSKGHDYVPEFRQDSDFLVYFEELSHRKNRSWNSVLFHLRAFHPGLLPIKAVNKDWLRSLQTHLLNTVKAALREAERDGLIVRSVASDTRIIKKQPTHTTYLSLEEVKRMIGAPCMNPEVERAFLFSCYTGLRISDVRRLKWGNILDNRIHFTQKKTGGVEYLPLNEIAISYLGQGGNTTDPIFNLTRGDWTIWDVVRQWGETAKLQRPISFHVSRHTFATLAFEHGPDTYAVSKMLGHSDIKPTQVYAKMTKNKLAQAMNLLRLPFA